MTSRNSSRPELLCIVCSGGAPDHNGAYTVCALCAIAEADVAAAA